MGLCSKIRFIRASFSLVGLCVATPAWADTNAANQAAADAVFSEASQRMAAHDYAAACPKFVEAQRLDPTAGTLLNLGLCYEQAGKLASALGAYGEAEAMAGRARDKARQDEALRRTKIVEGQVARLTINVSGSARIPGLIVKRDSESLGAAMWGTAIPVDPGEYTLEAAAPGRTTWTKKALLVAKAGSLTIEIPTLDPAPAEPRKGANAAGASEELATWWTGQRTTGVILSGVGVVGLVVGSIFGAQALSKYSDSQGHCQTAAPNVCSAEGVALRGSAGTAADISTASMIAGGVLLAGGVVLFVTAPSGEAAKNKGARLTAAPLMTSRVAGLLLQGEW